MAEHLLRHWSKTRDLDLEVSSCGIAAEPWYEMPATARRLLTAEGVPPFTHKARLATRDALRNADLILVMTQTHCDHLRERFPELIPRTRLLREHAGFDDGDVDDPMGRPDEAYARCLSVLKESLEALLSREFRGPERD
jgi:protein-tyrosine-phosphatase